MLTFSENRKQCNTEDGPFKEVALVIYIYKILAIQMYIAGVAKLIGSLIVPRKSVIHDYKYVKIEYK